MSGIQQAQPTSGEGGGQTITPSRIGRASDVLGVAALGSQQPQQQQPSTPQPQPLQQQPFAPQPQTAPTQYAPQQTTQTVPQQVPQQTPQVTQEQYQQAVIQAQQNVDAVDLNALKQNLAGIGQNNAADNGDTPPVQQQSQQQQPMGEADKNFANFNNQFKEVMGVDLKTAVNNYDQLTKTAQTAITQMQTMQNEMALERAKITLGNVWMMDSDVQQQIAQGGNIQNIVAERMQYLAGISRSLPPEVRQQIDSAGVAGVVQLWKSTRQQTQQQQVPVGAQAPQQQQPSSYTTPDGKSITREQILALSDKDFNAWGANLLDGGQATQQLVPRS